MFKRDERERWEKSVSRLECDEENRVERDEKDEQLWEY